MKIQVPLLLILVLFSVVSGARTPVYFFGGAGFSKDNAKAWGKGLASNTSYDFQAISFGSSAKLPDPVPKEIVIAGHSNGSRAAESWALALKKKHPDLKIKFYSLDGFTPSAELARKTDLTCVYAVGKGATRSRGQREMIACPPGGKKVPKSYQDCNHLARAPNPRARATQFNSAQEEKDGLTDAMKWCLHYRIVNETAGGTYQKMQPHLDWLDEEEPPPRSSEEDSANEAQK